MVPYNAGFVRHFELHTADSVAGSVAESKLASDARIATIPNLCVRSCSAETGDDHGKTCEREEQLAK